MRDGMGLRVVLAAVLCASFIVWLLGMVAEHGKEGA